MTRKGRHLGMGQEDNCRLHPHLPCQRRTRHPVYVYHLIPDTRMLHSPLSIYLAISTVCHTIQMPFWPLIYLFTFDIDTVNSQCFDRWPGL